MCMQLTSRWVVTRWMDVYAADLQVGSYQVDTPHWGWMSFISASYKGTHLISTLKPKPLNLKPQNP